MSLLLALGFPHSLSGVLRPHVRPPGCGHSRSGPTRAASAAGVRRSPGAMLGAGSRGRWRTGHSALGRRGAGGAPGLLQAPLGGALGGWGGVRPAAWLGTWGSAGSDLRQHRLAYNSHPSSGPQLPALRHIPATPHPQTAQWTPARAPPPAPAPSAPGWGGLPQASFSCPELWAWSQTPRVRVEPAPGLTVRWKAHH